MQLIAGYVEKVELCYWQNELSPGLQDDLPVHLHLKLAWTLLPIMSYSYTEVFISCNVRQNDNGGIFCVYSN